MKPPDPSKILMIAPYPVLPGTAGGKIRTLRLAREFAAAGIDVTLLTPYHPRQTRALVEREPFRLLEVPYPFVAPALLTGRPFPYGHLLTFNPGLGRWLKKTLARFDVVQFEQCFLAGLLPSIPSHIKVVYNSQNVDRDYISSECENEFVRRVATRRIERLERRLIDRADHVFCCSKEDGLRFVELYGTPPERLSLAPNGVRAPRACLQPADDLRTIETNLRQFRTRALFSGSNVPHNTEAVRFIARELAPAVEDDCAFIIHGACVNGARVRRSGDTLPRNVFAEPEPSAFERSAAASTVGINPVEQGSGTNLKVLHLLAHGLPVVSTDFGMRGYDDLRDFVTIRDRPDFASALRSGDVITPPRYDWLEERYGWDRVARHMIDVIGLLPSADERASARGR